MGQVGQPFALCPWAVVSLTLGQQQEGREGVGWYAYWGLPVRSATFPTCHALGLGA